MQTIVFPLAVILLWTASIWLATKKYRSAVVAQKKFDTWIWMFVWCAVLAFVEWPVYYIYQLVMKMLGTDVVL